jgi:hypothetical protein
MHRLATGFVLAIAMLCSAGVRGGASLLVDDADTTPEGRCQIENWLRLREGGHREMTAVPACTLDGLEYSLGGSAYVRTPYGPWLTADLKHTLLKMDKSTPGLAISLGGTWRRPDHHPASGNVVIIASLPLTAAFTLHTNLGWDAVRGAAPRPIEGLGMEYAFDRHWPGLGESYVERGAVHAAQAGLRRSFAHGLSCDLIAGHDHDGHWFTFGLNYSPGDS